VGRSESLSLCLALRSAADRFFKARLEVRTGGGTSLGRGVKKRVNRRGVIGGGLLTLVLARGLEGVSSATSKRTPSVRALLEGVLSILVAADLKGSRGASN
jgi:hypothetical protein